MSSPPPSYTTSRAAPSYSLQPQEDETRLEFTERLRSRVHTGTHIKTTKVGTLVFHQQEDGIESPTYVGRDIVRGAIILSNCGSINSVALKFQCNLSLNIPEGGSTTTPLVRNKLPLWSRETLRTDGECPSMIPFAFAFPLTFEDDGPPARARRMPPSYEISFPGPLGMLVGCSYTLKVVVKRTRSVVLWQNRSTAEVTLLYKPRLRPSRPLLAPPFTLLSTIKQAPEEWFQIMATMQTRPKSAMQPIHCSLFLPSVCIFAISDTIPFHLQLRAPIPSLRAFSPPALSTPPRTEYACLLHLNLPSLVPVVRVYLLRQIAAEVRGQKAWRNVVLGEGELRSLPPPASCSSLSLNTEDETHIETLDWEGEVRCTEDVKSGGFYAGKLAVKDFFVLTLEPPNPQSSPLVELQHAHPIRLVTDPWEDR